MSSWTDMSLWSEKSHNKYSRCLIILKFLDSSESLLSYFMGTLGEWVSRQEE